MIGAIIGFCIIVFTVFILAIDNGGAIEKDRKCQNCGHNYGKLSKITGWICNFRKPCPTPRCYWMIFKDGTQSHDYPGE
jgi:hypothetical protein